jgi:hypothetical protein
MVESSECCNIMYSTDEHLRLINIDDFPLEHNERFSIKDNMSRMCLHLSRDKFKVANHNTVLTLSMDGNSNGSNYELPYDIRSIINMIYSPDGKYIAYYREPIRFLLGENVIT